MRTTGVHGAAKRELTRMGSRPLYLVVTLILPIVCFLIILALFSRGVARDLPIAVCDLDHSALSRKIVRLLDASPGITVIASVADPSAGHLMIRQGKAYALVLIPYRLESDVLAGKAPVVVNYYNNEFLLPGSLVSRDIRSVINSISKGIDLRQIQKRAGSGSIDAGAVEPIRVDQHELFNPYLNYAYFLATALLPTMLQIFVLVACVYAVGSEFKGGSAGEWLAAGGGRVWKAVLGKMIPYTVIFTALSMVMIIVVFAFLGVPLKGKMVVILAATICFVIDYEVISLFIVSMTANLRLSLNFAAFYGSTAFAFVGITFPTIGLPLVAKTWAAIIPLSYYLKVLTDQGIRGTPAVYAFSPLAKLVGFIPAFLVLPALTM